MADLPPRAPPPRTDSRDSLLCSETSDPPEPKWWLLEWMNYLIMAIFLGSVCYHVQQTTFAPKLQRDATSLLPMLTIWSCCMAYFFGFFGISFVDKDEDLLMEFEHTQQWECAEELPRTLGSIVEDTGAATHTPSNTTPRALSTQTEEEPIQELRNADDAERVSTVLARSRSLQVDVVGPLSIDGRETLVPLADYNHITRLVQRGARVLRLAGGCATAAGKIHEVEIGICVACPTLATAQSLTDAALARAALARKAPGADPVAIVDASRVGRCCYARVACADAERTRRASERLHEVTEAGDWDLIVLDTPPAANALDFFDAPGRFFDALDTKALQWVMQASTGGLMGMGAQFLLRTLGRFTGGEFFEELGVFLRHFSGLLDGFRERTAATAGRASSVAAAGARGRSGSAAPSAMPVRPRQSSGLSPPV